MKKACVVRKHNDLCASFSASLNLVSRVIAPEAVQACEGIIENDNLDGPVRILLQLRQKEGEREGTPVARAESIPEARPVRRRPRISEINCVLIDEDLVARTWWPAPVGVRRRGDPETRVYPFQVAVNALAVLRDDLLRMSVELLPCPALVPFKGCLLTLQARL